MYGFIRVAAATPQIRVADCSFNVAEVCSLISEASLAGVQAICFPELCLTGYTCADLFFTQRLQRDALAALEQVCRHTASLPLVVMVGLPLLVGGRLYNVAAVLQGGRVHGFVPKTHIPNNGEFYEKRWFVPGRTAVETMVHFMGNEMPFGTDLLFRTPQCTFGVEICEDLWAPIPPGSQLAIQGAELLFNLSASNEAIGKNAYRRQLVCQLSARCHAGYVYASAGTGESTTDLVFGGSAFIAENGTLLAEGERFAENSRLLVHEIDVERLVADRIHNTNFFADRQDEQNWQFINEEGSEPYYVRKNEDGSTEFIKTVLQQNTAGETESKIVHTKSVQGSDELDVKIYDMVSATNEQAINGEIDGFFIQGTAGDCWLLATLNSLNSTEAGKEAG